MGNRQNIANVMSEKLGISNHEALKVVNAIVEEIVDQCFNQGNEIYLCGFGSFKMSKRKSRKVRHIKAGYELTLPNYEKLAFKSEEIFRDKVSSYEGKSSSI